MNPWQKIDQHMVKYGLLKVNQLPKGKTLLMDGLKENEWRYAIDKFFDEFQASEEDPGYWFVSFDVCHKCIFFHQFIVFLYKVDVADIQRRLLKQYRDTLRPQKITLKMKSEYYDPGVYLRIAQEVFPDHIVIGTEDMGAFYTTADFILLPRPLAPTFFSF